MKYFDLANSNWSKFGAFIMLVALHFISVNANSQSCSLACNGDTQVSLDENCEALITADMILNDQTTSCPNGSYVVTVSNIYGDVGNPVTSPYIGQELYVKVTDVNSGNSCWGNITLEDKLGPIIDSCPGTVEVACTDLSAYEGPTFFDPCEGFKDPVLLRETVDPLACDPRYIKSVIRVYTAYDSNGSAAPECTVTYNLLRFDFDDINCPPEYTQHQGGNICFVGPGALSCDGEWKLNQPGFDYDTDTDGDGVLDKDVVWDDNGNGYPDPAEVGIPTILTEVNGEPQFLPLFPFPDVYCNTVVTFEDVEYPVVNCTRKIVRRWTFREWHCTDERVETRTQIIEITDEEPPVIECPSHIVTTTNVIMGSVNSHYGDVTCGANTTIPLPDATDNCSTHLSYDITFDGGFFGDYDGTQPIMLPMGTNEVMFTVYDECYNSSSCVVNVSIEDNTPPVTVCDQFTAVSLTAGGEAVVNAYSFDDGSYDDCKAHCMLVQRMTPDGCDCRVPEFCDLDYVGELNGSYYYLSDYEVTADIAKRRAEAYGGSLVIFENSIEQDWLLNRLRPNYSGDFWIGMKRFGNGFLWDDHSHLTYTDWAPGNPSGSAGVTYEFIAPNLGNTILFNDGAQVDNTNDMVSNLRLKNGPTLATIDIYWDWFAPSVGDFTVKNGINMKLLHYNGSHWEIIYTERYTGSETTNTIAPLLNTTQTGFFRYTLPNNTGCGVNYFRIAIEDNSYEWDAIMGNFATGADQSHFDNADISFLVSSEQCSEDCVIMDDYNNWNDVSCYYENRYVLEIKDICGFSQIANFCCSDVGTEQMVTFRVVDIFGNYNDCMVSIDVQDKIAPSLICPANTTVDCDIPFDVDNLDIYGTPVLSDDCGADVVETGINELSNCNLGTYTRVFTATDDGGRSSSCKQVLTFVNPDPFTGQFDVICPPDTTIVGCMVPDDLSPDVMGFPEFTTQRCGLLGTDWDDDVYTFNNNNGDACFKILRKWEVIDWCQPHLPVFTCTQVIKVTNGVRPVIEGCEDQEICTYDSECLSGFIELEVSATDDCTQDENLSWRYQVYAGELGVGPTSFTNPVVEDSGDGPVANASGEYPIGTHIVRWTFFDRCGNATTCDQQFTIANCKAPTPYCINGLAVNLMPMDNNGDGEPDFGMVELWASDFDAGSFHPCGYEVTLSFSEDEIMTNMTFDCAMRGNVEVNIWASVEGLDGERIQSFCTTVVNIQDNNNACQGQNPGTVDLGGQVFTEDLENMSQVEVELAGSSLMGMTDSNGEYTFPDMPMGGDYVIKPKYDKDPLNGVSTLDIIEIQRHLLGLQKIESPYKQIAADINRDYRISTTDLLELRRLILGVYNNFPNNESWRFIDNHYDFIDPQNALNEDFKEDYLISKLEKDMYVDFIAVKVGDVNDNSVANSNSNSVDPGINQAMELVIADLKFREGEWVDIPLNVIDKSIEGIQMTIDFDPALIELEKIISHRKDFDDNNYRILDGKILMSWNNAVGSDNFDTSELFTIRAFAKSDGTTDGLLNISSDVLRSEAYDKSGNIMQPIIRTERTIAQAFSLSQNTPNPFADNTELRFNLPEASYIEMTISDIRGRVVKTIDGNYTQGLNSVNIQANELGEAGIYYLNMRTTTQSETIKMVLIR